MNPEYNQLFEQDRAHFMHPRPTPMTMPAAHSRGGSSPAPKAFACATTKGAN